MGHLTAGKGTAAQAANQSPESSLATIIGTGHISRQLRGSSRTTFVSSIYGARTTEMSLPT